MRISYCSLCEITCKLCAGEAVEADFGDKGGELQVKTGGRKIRPRCFTSLWQRKRWGSSALLRFGKGIVGVVLPYFTFSENTTNKLCEIM